jgi:predicted nucleotidyltransferase component of viral defense system
MKEQIKQIIAKAPNRLLARNLVREYCQARILQFLQECGAFTSWIFHGGTALRLLYMLPRYSEDLDFALAHPSDAKDFLKIISAVCKSFEAEAYLVKSHKLKVDIPVKSAFITFPGLFYELGLSPHRTESLSVKVEVDSHPPEGGLFETSIIRRYVILNVLHYDQASLLSGKLHAILMRPYFKGRDLYDLYWYMSDLSWPEPNIRFLNEALHQTKWQGPEVTPTNWVQLVINRLESIDWPRAVDDVRPLIEREIDLSQLTRESVLKLLESRHLKNQKISTAE